MAKTPPMESGTKYIFQIGGGAAGLVGAVFWAKNWTWRFIYIGGGLAISFGIPMGYDSFIADKQ